MSGQPADEQLAGLTVPEQPAGSTLQRVRDALAEAQLDTRDGGAAALAEACARAVDLAHGRRDPYAVATCARELRETLTALRMTPAAREGADAGNVESWLAQLDAS